MTDVINDEKEINQRVYVFPTSAIVEDGKKIAYYDYISSLKSEDCNKALLEITKRINLDKINCIIDETEAISDLQKDFYKIMIAERKNKILDYSLTKLLNQ